MAQPVRNSGERHIISLILFVVLTVLGAGYLLNQVRKPTRWTGQLFVRVMNISHSGVTDWGLTHVRVQKDFTILDVGCGRGRTLQKLAALASAGRLFGVDYADGSIAASRRTNASLIESGRMEIRTKRVLLADSITATVGIPPRP